MEFATRTIHADQPSEPGTGALIAPIFRRRPTSRTRRRQPGVRLLAHEQPDARAARSGARRSRGRRAAACSPRLAAENAVLQAWLKPGDEIVIRSDVYGGTYRLLTKVFRPLGCTSARSISPTRRALERRYPTARRSSGSSRRPTRACSSTTSPRSAAAARAARRAPRRRQHFRHAALPAAIRARRRHRRAQRDEVPGRPLRPHSGRGAGEGRGVFEPIKFLQNATGAVPWPFDCWLTLRGLKTLELRVLRHAENAAAIADALQSTSAVTARLLSRPARPPGPRDRAPADDRVRRDGLFRARRHGGRVVVVRLVAAFFALGESLGGVKSLICHPARMTHASIPSRARELGLSDTLVRLSPAASTERPRRRPARRAPCARRDVTRGRPALTV